MKKKQRLYIEECTHKGEDKKKSLYAGKEYTQKKYYTGRELYIGKNRYGEGGVYMVECTHGKVYT